MDNGTDAYHYPNRYYNLSGATSTKHVFANNELVATIESNGATSTIYYIHTDHLGGSSVITDQEGEVVQLLDYYPYGGMRINERASSFDSSKKFTGKELDYDTGLYYYGSRYQNPDIGRFVSQDPAFHWIGQNDFEEKANRPLEQHLMNPQSLNSYSYVNNNPLRYTDPNGEIIPALLIAWAVAEFGLSAYDAYDLVKTFLSDSSAKEKGISLAGFIAGVIGPGGGYGKAGKMLDNMDDVRSLINKGHTIQKHVGKSDTFLLGRLKDTPGLKSASTFYNREIAESVISGTMSANKSKIDNWLANSTKETLTLNYSGNKALGRVADSATMQVTTGNNATVVLQRSGDSFHVLTSYVTN